ncbi:hypothetical protein BJ912DRAFT_973460 [Pholiota molesta]|nr:hypothetical protein BJ912DRAFT_973460 [Pholiota molesta]
MHASTFYRKRIFVSIVISPEPHYLRSLVATLIEYVVGYFIPFVACVEWTSSLSVTDFRALANSRGTVEPLFRLSASNARGTEASSTIVYSLLFCVPRMYPIRQAILTLSLQCRNRIISHLLLQLLAKRRRRIKIRSAPFLPCFLFFSSSSPRHASMRTVPSFFFILFLPLPSRDEVRCTHSTLYPQRMFVLYGGIVRTALFAVLEEMLIYTGDSIFPSTVLVEWAGSFYLLSYLTRVFPHSQGDPRSRFISPAP